MAEKDGARDAANRVAGDVAALGAMREDWTRHERAGLDEMLAASWIFRTQQHLVLRIESLIAPLGLTMTKFECLVVLLSSKDGALGMNKMAERLGVHPTSITYAVDALVKANLVERLPHPDDRRRKFAVLTRRGRDLTEEALDVLEADRFGIQPIGETKLRRLADLLREAMTPVVESATGAVEVTALQPLAHRTRGTAALKRTVPEDVGEAANTTSDAVRLYGTWIGGSATSGEDLAI